MNIKKGLVIYTGFHAAPGAADVSARAVSTYFSSQSGNAPRYRANIPTCRRNSTLNLSPSTFPQQHLFPLSDHCFTHDE